MTEPTEFVDAMVAAIATWHGVPPPNPVALRHLADLQRTIREFEALRGTLRFEDEPSSFEAALLEASAVRIAPQATPGTAPGTTPGTAS